MKHAAALDELENMKTYQPQNVVTEKETYIDKLDFKFLMLETFVVLLTIHKHERVASPQFCHTVETLWCDVLLRVEGNNVGIQLDTLCGFSRCA